MFKDRFRVINRDLEYIVEDVKRVVFLIISIFIIHNFLIDEDCL